MHHRQGSPQTQNPGQGKESSRYHPTMKTPSNCKDKSSSFLPPAAEFTLEYAELSVAADLEKNASHSESALGGG
jgi:hypothetical protein